MIEAKPVGANEFHLVYNGPNNSYLYITSKGKDQDQDQVVTVSVSNYHFKTFVSLEALIARKTKFVLAWQFIRFTTKMHVTWRI